MRILMIGALMGGSNVQGKSLHRALVSMGHEAEWLDFVDMRPAFEQCKHLPQNHPDMRDFLFALNERILKKVLDFRPDTVLGVAQSPMGDLEVLAAIKAAGILLCFWFIEDYTMFTYWKNIAHHFDYFFIFQKEPFYSQLRAQGCKQVHYLPAGFEAQHDIAVAPEQDIPLSFVGAPYPNRIHYFSQIMDMGLRLYGEGWPTFGDTPADAEQPRLSEKECRDIFLRTRISLNLHSSNDVHVFGQGDFVNPRTFDLAGLGLFQLVDKRALLPLHFDPVDEVLSLGSWEAFREAIAYYLDHENERKAIAAKAQRRVLAEHTYVHRAQEMLEILRG